MAEKCVHNLFGELRIEFNDEFKLIWGYCWKDGPSAASFHLCLLVISFWLWHFSWTGWNKIPLFHYPKQLDELADSVVRQILVLFERMGNKCLTSGREDDGMMILKVTILMVSKSEFNLNLLWSLQEQGC